MAENEQAKRRDLERRAATYKELPRGLECLRQLHEQLVGKARRWGCLHIKGMRRISCYIKRIAPVYQKKKHGRKRRKMERGEIADDFAEPSPEPQAEPTPVRIPVAEETKEIPPPPEEGRIIRLRLPQQIQPSAGATGSKPESGNKEPAFRLLAPVLNAEVPQTKKPSSLAVSATSPLNSTPRVNDE